MQLELLSRSKARLCRAPLHSILSSCLPVCYRSSFILLSSFSRRTQTRCNVSFLSYLKWCNVDVSLLLVPYYGLEDVLKNCFRLILMSLTDHFPWHGTVRHLISLLFFLREIFLMLTTLSRLIGLTSLNHKNTFLPFALSSKLINISIGSFSNWTQ